MRDLPADHTLVRLPLAATEDLRQRVLRPDGGPRVTVSHPEAVQLAVLDPHGTPLACAHVVPEGPPWGSEGPDGAPDGSAYRLRGVATDPAHRRIGLAEVCVAGLEQTAADAGATLVWCNARLAADAFYERIGWASFGDVFPIEHIGPHVVRWKRLDQAAG